MFHRIEMRSRLAGWDDKFIYVEQSMWRKGECTSHSLYRTALTDRNGIVPPERVKEALGIEGAEPQLPEWVVAWAGAESLRPWPPMSPTPS